MLWCIWHRNWHSRYLFFLNDIPGIFLVAAFFWAAKSCWCFPSSIRLTPFISICSGVLNICCFHVTEKALPTLFKKYMQVSADHARKYGGTGLGLAICKQLVGCTFIILCFTFIILCFYCQNCLENPFSSVLMFETYFNYTICNPHILIWW